MFLICFLFFFFISTKLTLELSVIGRKTIIQKQKNQENYSHTMNISPLHIFILTKWERAIRPQVFAWKIIEDFLILIARFLVLISETEPRGCTECHQSRRFMGNYAGDVGENDDWVFLCDVLQRFSIFHLTGNVSFIIVSVFPNCKSYTCIQATI